MFLSVRIYFEYIFFHSNYRACWILRPADSTSKIELNVDYVKTIAGDEFNIYDGEFVKFYKAMYHRLLL